jgi:hypothetical protein
MGEMKIDLWLYFTENLPIVGRWLIFCVGIILSILQFKKNPKRSTLILFAFVTFLLLDIGNILVFFGAFYSQLREGNNREIFRWVTNIFGILGWVSFLFALFSKETKIQENLQL